MYSIGGIGQMTPTQQQTVRKAMGKAVGGLRKAAGTGKKRGKYKKKARPAAAKAKRGRPRKARAAKKNVRFAKGSAAAKAWGAKMRALRKKKSK